MADHTPITWTFSLSDGERWIIGQGFAGKPENPSDDQIINWMETKISQLLDGETICGIPDGNPITTHPEPDQR